MLAGPLRGTLRVRPLARVRVRRDAAAEPRSFVVGEWLGFKPGAFVVILEHVDDADCGRDPLDPALEQLDLGLSPKARASSRSASALATSPGVGLLSG